MSAVVSSDGPEGVDEGPGAEGFAVRKEGSNSRALSSVLGILFARRSYKD
jgi:hypothetical protein